MTVKIKFIIFYFIVAIFTTSHALANKEVSIAAVVGGSAISTVDINERIKIAMFASNMPPEKGLEEKLLPQILRNLIDEKIYRKEAEHLHLEVTDEEMSKIVADIETRNSIRPGKFKEFMESNGVSSTSMLEQIRSQLTWNKIVAKKIRPQITVTDKEIAEKMENILKKNSVDESNISEIVLLADSTEEQAKTKELASKLVVQLTQGGNFAKIAKEFSKASSAQNGGEIGWINNGQLSDEISIELKKLKVGEVSKPIRVAEGYTILKLNKKRSTSATAPTADLKAKIHESIFIKKLETQANRYLRDLRRGAFVEVRM